MLRQHWQLREDKGPYLALALGCSHRVWTRRALQEKTTKRDGTWPVVRDKEKMEAGSKAVGRKQNLKRIV